MGEDCEGRGAFTSRWGRVQVELVRQESLEDSEGSGPREFGREERMSV